MKVPKQLFNIGIATEFVNSSSPNFRPPSWPPKPDWPVVIDKDGVIVSRWGDPKWDLSVWKGARIILDFGDGMVGKAYRLDAENAYIMRMVATWLIWGPGACKAVDSVKANFTHIRKIAKLCSENGISAGDLTRFPKVLDQIPAVLAKSKYTSIVALLWRLYDARDYLGFIILDQAGLQRTAKASVSHVPVQTAYIPPRIWQYQVNRLRECITDFLAQEQDLRKCFQYCLDEYVMTYGSITAALQPGKGLGQSAPFSEHNRKGDKRFLIFSDVATHFGISALLAKWLGRNEDKLTVGDLSAYFSVVVFAGLAYIANFTLQRKKELRSLRTSCLHWDDDETYGRVPIICGETTKTVPDSDARWVASPSVDVAVQAVTAIAHLRMLCDRENTTIRPTLADQADPYLNSTPTEPWGSSVGQSKRYDIRVPVVDYSKALQEYYRALFDLEKMRITSDDLQIALRLTPELPSSKYKVGVVWPLTWHQYRRTGAVNMFASGLISDNSMQHQMKHFCRLMPLYYGRNHTRLHLNKEVATAVLFAMCEAQVDGFKSAVLGDQFLSPYSSAAKEQLAGRLLSIKDVKELHAMAKKGITLFRENRLGGCMKGASCEYGGIESVARCGGGDNGKACPEVLFDRSKEAQVRADMRRVKEEIKRSEPTDPKSKALIRELKAMENYLHVIGTS